MERKPRIFIGSSVESLPIADAINENLDHSAEVTIWRNGTFELSSNTIDSLLGKAISVDFAIFIFSPDDVVTIRNESKKAVRDNVIFELGLFIGTIGKKRCFIVKPREISLHLPTDLLGMTPVDYDSARSDGDLPSALNYACSKIKKEIGSIGITQNIHNSSHTSPKLVAVSSDLFVLDLQILSILLATYTQAPEGYHVWSIKNELDVKDSKVDLSLIKMEKLGYVAKENGHDTFGQPTYSYTITQDGVEVLVKNEIEIPTATRSNDSPF